jgi:superfamily II DNA or RNA helicase
MALFMAAGGRCQMCGDILSGDWHADHRVPWSAGGPTDLLNGQALCVSCNLKKGSRQMKTKFQDEYNLPAGIELRDWQKEAIDEFMSRISSRGIDLKVFLSFLCVACPGAGKTIYMLAVAYLLRQLGIITWIEICVPSTYLTLQVAATAKKLFGLDLWHGSALDMPNNEEFHGRVSTYQAVCMGPDVWRAKCSSESVFLIADEVHHVGDEKAWGETFKFAFNGAKYRLLTSGTPFRSDNQPIPYVNYAEDDKGNLVSKSDYVYGYGDALRDGVCRHVVFLSYDGRMEWLSGSKTYNKSFSEDLPLSENSKRRRTCLKADGEWIEKVIEDADARLSRIRGSNEFDPGAHEDAGGLVVCIDKEHANRVAKVLERKTGEKPVVVTSDDLDPLKKIKDFSNSKARWIVAVKMVSEGIDIPRLRVEIYATNVMTEMYFRQIMGRIVRVIGNYDDETSYMYIYDDAQLVEFAQKVREEINHVIKQQEEEENNLSSEAEKSDAQQLPLIPFLPISSNGVESRHLLNGESYGSEELAAVRGHATALGIPEAKVAELMRRIKPEIQAMLADKPSEQQDAPVQEDQFMTKTELLSDLRKRIKPLAHRLARILSPDDPDFQLIHRHWMHGYPGSQGQSKANEQELRHKIDWLKFCIAHAMLTPVKTYLEMLND